MNRCPHCHGEVPADALVCRTCLRELHEVPAHPEVAAQAMRDLAAEAMRSFDVGDLRLTASYAEQMRVVRPDLPVLVELHRKLEDLTNAPWDIPMGLFLVVVGFVGIAAAPTKAWIGLIGVLLGLIGIATGASRLRKRARLRAEVPIMLRDLTGQ